MSSCCQCAAAPSAHQPPAESGASPPRRVAWVRLALAAAVAGQSMIFSLAINVSPPTGRARLVLHAALAASAVAVFLLAGLPLLRAAWSALLRGRIVFEQLFLAGILGAFAASVFSSCTGVGHVYYEVVAILLAIYTFGRIVGERRRTAVLDAARALGDALENCQRVTAAGRLETIPVREVRRGDTIHLPHDGAVPVDGTVVEGFGLVDESTLTGEPFPVGRRPGDPVLAGSRLLDGPLRVRASADGGSRLIDALLARVRTAQARPSRLQREADRLVAWFLPAVVVVAALTFAGWTLRAGWTTGLFNALAVVLVACPCSMGLATPIGVWSALADLARRGVIAASADLVERLAQVDRALFDKTGTLSGDRPVLVDFLAAPGFSRETLFAEVAALESASEHPIARAFRAPGPDAVAAATGVRLLPGIGIEGQVGPAQLRVGNAGLLPADAPVSGLRAGLRGADASTRELYVLRNGALAGIALLREELRASTRAVLAELEAAGIPCTVLTGDQPAATAVHGFARAEAALDPLAKAARVRALGGRALFVGDGVNDAPAMAEAHASLALAAGHPLARQAALGEIRDLRALPYALARSRAAVAAIRRNLLFAAAYNTVGIGLAAAGILHPVAAALLMLGSSLTVGALALRPVAVPLTPRRDPAPLSPEAVPA